MENRLVFSRPPQQIFVLQVQKFLNGKLQKVKKKSGKRKLVGEFYIEKFSVIPAYFCEFCGQYILWCVLCVVYSFICGCRGFHEMEIPITENVHGNFYFYIWHSVSPTPFFINSAVI